jgi:hypothetical protein
VTGVLYDVQGNYTLGILIAAATMLCSTICLCMLPGGIVACCKRKETAKDGEPEAEVNLASEAEGNHSGDDTSSSEASASSEVSSDSDGKST